MQKKKILYITLMLIIILLWVASIWGNFSLYKEVKDFIIEGASYNVNIIIFFNYRYSPMILYILTFFVLSVISYTYYFLSKEKKVLLVFLVLMLINISVTNVFIPVYIIINFLSFIITKGSFIIASTIFNNKTYYVDGDLLFKSASYDSYEKAKDALNVYMSNNEKLIVLPIESVIIEENNRYLFELIFNEDIALYTTGGNINYDKV